MNIACLMFGHKPHKIRWVNVYRYCSNRKGGKKRDAGVWYHKVKHYRVYCERCGKLLKKK